MADGELGTDLPSRLTTKVRVILGALVLASALAAIEGNIVNTALPVIASELNGLSQLSWILTGFMLVQAASLPLYGKISDMYGRKPLFLIAIALFIISSALCGMAQNMGQLIAFRSLQGAGAAGIMTMSSATLADILTPRERSRYQSLFVATFAISNLAGPPLGGLLITHTGWRGVFWINVPLGLLIFGILWAALPTVRKRVQHRIDFLGAGLLIAATTTLLLALTWGGQVHPWASPQILSLIAATPVLIYLLYRRELVAAEPILPLHVFKDRTVTAVTITTALVAFPFFGAVVFLQLYFQVVKGMSPAQAGLMSVAQLASFLAVSIIGGIVVSHTGRYKRFIVAGVVCMVFGLAGIGLCAWLRLPTPLFLVGLAVLGAGGGMCMPNFTVVVQNTVEPKDLGAATATNTFANVLAGAAGVASAGAILSGRLDAYVGEHLPGVDAHKLLQGGLLEFARLPPAMHEVVLEAHARAVGATFLTGSVVMLLALATAISMPSTALKTKPKLNLGVDPEFG